MDCQPRHTTVFSREHIPNTHLAKKKKETDSIKLTVTVRTGTKRYADTLSNNHGRIWSEPRAVTIVAVICTYVSCIMFDWAFCPNTSRITFTGDPLRSEKRRCHRCLCCPLRLIVLCQPIDPSVLCYSYFFHPALAWTCIRALKARAEP